MVGYVGEASHTFSAQGISLFLLATGRIQMSERKEGFRPVREAFTQRAWKQSESLVLRVVPDEEFMHTEINNKDIYVDYVYDYVVLAIEDIPENVAMQFQKTVLCTEI